MGLTMGSPRIPPSRRFVAEIKRAAKAAARAGSETHSAALERLAREHGYASWDAVSRAADATGLRTPGGLLVDPALPKDFDNTANDSRSKAELDRWWNKPYVLTCADGTFEVRCLDGGAWDRSTWYGHASTLEAADALAAEKLARWLEFMRRPAAMMSEDGRMQVVRMPQRPDGDYELLYDAQDSADARRFIDGTQQAKADGN